MKLALSFLVGLPLLTILMFGSNLLGLPLNSVNVILLFFLVLAVLFVLWRLLPEIPSAPHSPSKVSKVLRIVIITLTALVLVNDSYKIVGEWDALTLYDFRARRIVETGSIQAAAEIQGSYFYSYPLFTSLAHSFAYLLGATSPMLIYGLIFTAFLFLFYSLLRGRVGEELALFGTLLTIFAPHLFWHAQIAYTNLSYTVYLVLGALFLLGWEKNRQANYAILGMFFTGVSVWVRSTEPFWLGNLLLFFYISVRNRQPITSIISLAVFYPLEQLWKRYVTAMYHPLGSTLSQISGSTQAVVNAATSPNYRQQLIETISFFTSSVVRPYAPVLLLFIVSILIQIKKRHFDSSLILLILFNLGIALVGTFVFAISQPYWREIPGSLERMVMFISPLIIYQFVTALKSQYEK